MDNTTKKTLSLLSLIGAFCTCEALAETENYTRVNPNEGAGVIINNSVALNLTMVGDSTAFSEHFSSFGYYVIDNNGNNSLQKTLDWSSANNGTMELGSFSEGETVAFWARGINQAIVYDSMNSLSEKGTSRDSAYVNNNGDQDITITMGTIGANGYGAVKPNLLSDENLTFKISTHSSATTPASSGQPLPGVLATLGLSTLTLAALKKIKEQRKERN